jgi:hypothetical protein
MAILLVILFLAVIALTVAGKKTPALRVLAVILAGIAAAVAVLRLFTFAPGEGLTVDVPPEEALGFVLASRVQTDYPDGGKVIVFGPQTDEDRLLEVTTARMEGIQRVLGESHQIVVRGPLVRYGNMEDSEAWSRMTLGFPLRSFQEWAAADEDAVAAISLLGMPAGNLNRLEATVPPLYVAGINGLNRDPNRLPPGIATVVTYRNDRDFDVDRAKQLQEIFDQTFVAYPPLPQNDKKAPSAE